MIDGQTLLITGGTGSFGRAFIRTILATTKVDQVISVSRNAELRYELEQEHLEAVKTKRLHVLPGDVRSLDDLTPAFKLRPDVVVHAAAEKHIGTGQQYKAYTYGVNVVGAQNVINLAVAAGVSRVVALSTDKACEPVNFYGETKQEAEEEFLAADAERCGPRFSLVRYGNVVASSGSVVPLFLQQRESGRLTVTDRRMTRFFMPIADPPFCEFPVSQNGEPVMSAVRLVLTALREMQGGEIFVPTIPSARIEDLARAIAPEAEIVETGIRDGEKLHEMLISPREAGRTHYRTEDGVYVVLPEERFGLTYALRVPQGFSYTSEQTGPISVTTALAEVA